MSTLSGELAKLAALLQAALPFSPSTSAASLPVTNLHKSQKTEYTNSEENLSNVDSCHGIAYP